jgi:hypothetical protein
MKTPTWPMKMPTCETVSQFDGNTNYANENANFSTYNEKIPTFLTGDDIIKLFRVN